MKSLVLNVDDTVYEKLVNFLKILPKNKCRILEETPLSKESERKLKKREKKLPVVYYL